MRETQFDLVRQLYFGHGKVMRTRDVQRRFRRFVPHQLIGHHDDFEASRVPSGTEAASRSSGPLINAKPQTCSVFVVLLVNLRLTLAVSAMCKRKRLFLDDIWTEARMFWEKTFIGVGRTPSTQCAVRRAEIAVMPEKRFVFDVPKDEESAKTRLTSFLFHRRCNNVYPAEGQVFFGTNETG